MLSIRQDKPNAKYVLMPRIDQKSCIKSILAAGYTPIILENELHGDELRTNLKQMEEKINELEADQIACIFSVTSCFAPRSPDKIDEIAVLCKKHNLFHLINNAYGLQSTKCTHLINTASKVGRVDAVVQSTDKNLMVPVGGAIIAAYDEQIIHRIANLYPGRASSSQSMDVLITLLSMGAVKYKLLLQERKDNFNHLKNELNKLAVTMDEKLLNTPNNQISLAFSLASFGANTKEITEIGSFLFTRNVTGVRVVAPGETKQLGSVTFKNFNSHSNSYPCSYLTCAAAIGMKRDEIDLFIKRLHKVLDQAKHTSDGEINNNTNESGYLTINKD